jgi:hypothetical protein
MATHDYVIDNQTSANARADINNVLQAILTNNSSSTAPTVTNANMFWYDTANNVLKMRNEADTGWIIVGYLNQTTNQMEVRTDVIQAASGSGISVKNSSGTTIIDLSVASQATAEAGTEDTQVMTPLKVKQSIDANVTPSGWEYVDGATGNGDTTQIFTGLSVYRTVKVIFAGQYNRDARVTLYGATTSTYRVFDDFYSDEGESGSITIHNWNNADAPTAIKVLDRKYTITLSDTFDFQDYDIKFNLSSDEVSYNEAWDRLKFYRNDLSGNNSSYKVRVFGMR